jgi:hypothetical protein
MGYRDGTRARCRLWPHRWAQPNFKRFSNPGSFAILAAIRRASLRAQTGTLGGSFEECSRAA